MELRKAILLFFFGIVIISVMLASFGVTMQKIDFILVNFVIPLLLGILLSAFIGSVIKPILGDFFEGWDLEYNIYGITFDVPSFPVPLIIWIVKLIVFG